jgi:hypothetical protein
LVRSNNVPDEAMSPDIVQRQECKRSAVRRPLWRPD